MKIKALLIGDNLLAQYHPLKGVDEKLKNILQDSCDISVTEDYGVLANSAASYDLIICYGDRFGEALKDDEIGGLISFVADGGGMLVIHNGISFSIRPEFKSMAGASFSSHPEARILPFYVQPEHPICEGITDFEMFEEPYQYNFCSHLKPEVFLTYHNEEKIWEAGWTLGFGKGKVVSLHPGHDVKSFENFNYNQIINRSALWCTGRL